MTMKKLIAWATTIHPMYFFIVIGFLVYANSLVNGFVADDSNQIINNTQIHSIWNIRSFFTQSTFYDEGTQRLVGLYYKPIFTTFLSIIYTFFGSNSSAFHFFQVSIHIVNVCLLYVLLQRFLKRSTASVLSLIFLVHPINSESVLYISAMQDVLFFAFGIAGLIIIQKTKTQRGFMLGIFFLLLSLLAKETGILFVGISGLYVWLYKRKYMFAFICYVGIISGIYFLLRTNALTANTTLAVDVPIMELSIGRRLLQIPAIVAFYLTTFILPLNLAMSYHWIVKQIDLYHVVAPLTSLVVGIAVGLWFGISLYIKHQSGYATTYFFFFAWFLLGMLLHIQIIPLDYTVAERWFYFPIVGILGMAGIVYETLFSYVKTKWIVAIIALTILLLSLRTFLRTYDWRNDYTLASHDRTVSPDSHSFEFMLGAYFYNKKEYQKARTHIQNAVSIYPSASGYINLGLMNFVLKDYASAKKAYLTSFEYNETDRAHMYLALLALYYGDPAKNIDFIKHISLKKYPQKADLWLSLAKLEYNFGNKKDARASIVKAYQYESSQRVDSVYKAILNNEPVPIDLKRQ